jgi:hypothetical protein
LTEMRIVVPDTASASALAERLTVAFGSEHISLGRGRSEVDVLIDREPESAIVRVIDTVERWVEQARVDTVELWLGERSYRLGDASGLVGGPAG